MELLKNKDFLKKTSETSQLLGVDVNDLLAVMISESGLNPSAVNKTGGAVGLIQFMPSTLKYFGYTPQVVVGNWSLQLDLVYKYYKPFKGKLKNYQDLYLATFYPYALKMHLDYIIGSEKGEKYQNLVGLQNPSINDKKPFTKAQFLSWVEKRKNIQNIKLIVEKAKMPLLVFIGIGFILKMILP